MSFLTDVQTYLLSSLDIRIVIPPRKASFYKKIKLLEDLIPIFSIKGDGFALETPKMAAVPNKSLKKSGNFKNQQHQIIAAIDRLFHGL